MTCFYSLIRFVPNTARGEFINIGAVVGDLDSGEWELRLISNMRRARAIDTAGYLPAAMSFLGEMEARLPSDDEDDSDFSLEELTALSTSMNNLVQMTKPEPIVAADTAQALDILARDLLMDPEVSTSYRFKNTGSAIGATNRAYRDQQLPEAAVQRKVAVEAGRFTDGFDFVVHNGSAVQVVKCFSFQRPNEAELIRDLKAWGYLVNEVQEHGGTVKPASGKALPTASDLSIASVFVPPVNPGSEAFGQANDIFHKTKVLAAPYTAPEPVAAKAIELLGRHGALASP